MNFLPLLFLATIVATSQAIPNPIHLLRPHSGAGGHPLTGVNCLSWRLAVETDNIINWDVVPEECENYVGHYMLGSQYRQDCNAVAAAAYKYATSVTLKGDGKDIWIFDIDETTLSNVPYYALPENAFGAKVENDTSFTEWTQEAKAPAIPGTLNLYKKLLKLGYKIVYLTGRDESSRNSTEKNLKNVGYHTWEKLILRDTAEENLTAVVYKSANRGKLVKQGYRIIGNMGDQWSDLLGDHPGNRTFKVPDPMYYIA